ncbi:MAG: hypothetical protein K8S99_06245 [Planctomycetes bacterium]|nr:hypothetical protein [Planctomycetota bacterium]
MTNPVQATDGGISAAPLRVPGGGDAPRRGEPVTVGVPWPRGVLRDSAALNLIIGGARAVPVQSRVLDRWSDGSVRWALVDWLADSGADYLLKIGDTPGRAPADTPRAAIRETGKVIEIDTGAALFTINSTSNPNQTPFPFADAKVHGRQAINPARSTLMIEDDAGHVYHPAIDRVVIEDRGPVRVSVRMWGRLASPDAKPTCDLTARVECFAGSTTVRLTLTLTNPRAAGHPDGKWDLGNEGSIYLRRAALSIAMPVETASSPDDAAIRYSCEPGAPLTTAAGDRVEVYQDSSGGENWKSSNHLNRKQEVPLGFQGYRLVVAKAGAGAGNETRGRRATPIVLLQHGERALGAATQYFWQNFPKAIEAASDVLTVGLFPRQSADVHEIQGGERKTHTLHLAYGPDTVTDTPLDWARSPLVPAVDPAWASQAQAAPYLLPRAEDPNADYLALIDAAVEGPDTFERKREVIDEYGWRHFGDIYGDHEAVFDKGERPLVSHYNNQYDAVRGLATQFLRSADPRWFHAMNELASHVADIDLYHTDADKSAYNHGLFWHTCHYIDADTGTHRSYPGRKKVPGGGPSGGHLYTTGFMLHHLVTGDPLSREAAIGLAQYVIDADDGSKTIFRFLDRGDTGHITLSGYGNFHGPGRAAANALNALTDGHRLTGERRFLDKAEQIIRRAVHPTDDPDRMNLLKAEDHWFYTMFLQSLGKYLDHKAELGELDMMYAYGRAVLVHYANWMAAKEYPYLDKPKELEYPTETWAAQDMRKSEVFRLASRHVDDAQRTKLLERAEFFFRYSVRTLASMPTRTLCRPVVLLLSYGNAQGYFQKRAVPPAPAPVGTFDFGTPTRFVPQKDRAKSKLKRLIVMSGLLFVAIAAAVVFLLVVRP